MPPIPGGKQPGRSIFRMPAGSGPSPAIPVPRSLLQERILEPAAWPNFPPGKRGPFRPAHTNNASRKLAPTRCQGVAPSARCTLVSWVLADRAGNEQARQIGTGQQQQQARRTVEQKNSRLLYRGNRGTQRLHPMAAPSAGLRTWDAVASRRRVDAGRTLLEGILPVAASGHSGTMHRRRSSALRDWPTRWVEGFRHRMRTVAWPSR